MYLRLNYQSGEAIYRQIVEQIKYKVASGELTPGQRLTSIRELAKQLKINPRTVVKAYEELRASGLAVMRQGQGVFVTDNQATLPNKVRKKQIEDMSKRLFAEANRLGANSEEVIKIINETAENMRQKK
ncbi:MAG: GntR family transcriptional regulator [Planctomycetota bacterium]|jgi:GntR family transcriptional regulator